MSHDRRDIVPSCATSDAQGAFRIGEVRSGAYRLEARPKERSPFTSEPVKVHSGLDGTEEIALPRLEPGDAERATKNLTPRFDLTLGVQDVTNRCNFASYTWNRRTHTQQFGEQQGIFPIVGLDWRF